MNYHYQKTNRGQLSEKQKLALLNYLLLIIPRTIYSIQYPLPPIQLIVLPSQYPYKTTNIASVYVQSEICL